MTTTAERLDQIATLVNEITAEEGGEEMCVAGGIVIAWEVTEMETGASKVEVRGCSGTGPILARGVLEGALDDFRNPPCECEDDE